MNLFNHKKLIATIPLDPLSIHQEELIHFRKRENGILIGSQYTIERHLARQLLEAIITDENQIKCRHLLRHFGKLTKKSNASIIPRSLTAVCACKSTLNSSRQ